MPISAVKHGQFADNNGARIGPNSLIQTVQALEEKFGKAGCAEILERGGQANLLPNMPVEMVDEREFITLAQMLFNQLGTAQAKQILYRSGQLTTAYLLKNRIPKPVQLFLKVLLKRLRLRLVLTSIGKNAWTFAGSGSYSFSLAKEPTIVLANSITGQLHCDTKGLICDYYSATFATLLQTLVNPAITVQEVECLANGNPKCSFAIHNNF